jgi:hypothetical protein
MAITVVNGTPATGVEFMICGYVDGSANPAMWSGSLQPAGQEGDANVMEVSGFESYGVFFYPVGYNGDNMASAWSPEVTDNTIVALNIDVDAN